MYSHLHPRLAEVYDHCISLLPNKDLSHIRAVFVDEMDDKTGFCGYTVDPITQKHSCDIVIHPCMFEEGRKNYSAYLQGYLKSPALEHIVMHEIIHSLIWSGQFGVKPNFEEGTHNSHIDEEQFIELEAERLLTQILKNDLKDIK